MNDYEERKQARIDRYRERAERARQEADSRHDAARKIQSFIPFGQPILVGHHSEKHHRADLKRIDGHMGKAVEASAKARHYEEQAAAAESSTTISSDDPAAVEKLQEKLAWMEAYQEQLKADNRALRKAKISPNDAEAVEKMQAAGVSEHGIRALLQLASVCRFHCEPYYKHPGYELTNNNANVKRVRQRIKELEQRTEAVEAEPVKGDGFTISEDADWGRVLIEFDGKPAEPVRKYLKSHGWRWAKSRLAWVRHLNGNGRMYAGWAAEKLPGLLKAKTA